MPDGTFLEVTDSAELGRLLDKLAIAVAHRDAPRRAGSMTHVSAADGRCHPAPVRIAKRAATVTAGSARHTCLCADSADEGEPVSELQVVAWVAFLDLGDSLLKFGVGKAGQQRHVPVADHGQVPVLLKVSV